MSLQATAPVPNHLHHSLHPAPFPLSPCLCPGSRMTGVSGWVWERHQQQCSEPTPCWVLLSCSGCRSLLEPGPSTALSRQPVPHAYDLQRYFRWENSLLIPSAETFIILYTKTVLQSTFGFLFLSWKQISCQLDHWTQYN